MSACNSAHVCGIFRDSTRMRKSACDRDDVSFMAVLAAALRLSIVLELAGLQLTVPTIEGITIC
eukprot:5398937-Amphidinium_carterae.1